MLFIWKKSAAELEQMEPLLAALVEGVVIIDHNLKIQLINQRARHYLSLEATEVVGQPIASLEQAVCENLIIESYKLKKPLMAVITSEQLGEMLDVTAIYRDKQPFIILIIQNQTCLHRATEFARDFIANASHELKTPITIVRGFAETLHEHPELSKEITQEITKRIVDNCDRMVSLVKNLLSLTTIDETILTDRLHKCNPRDIAEAARAIVLELHPSAEIIIKEAKPITMIADKELVLQALVNLLDNGIKYSDKKPKIEMHISQDTNGTRIEVRDFGRGIAKENFDRIFERFYAVDKQLSRSLGGYGLGLSITKRIMEKHHGRIELRSKEGEGSSFTLLFPN
jgi:signal transduction histidine kinase